MKRKIALVATQTIALYSFAGWVYIAIVALVEPDTLSWQLTHLAPYPREDTFGEACFVISMVSYFVHHLLRSPKERVWRRPVLSEAMAPDEDEAEGPRRSQACDTQARYRALFWEVT